MENDEFDFRVMQFLKDSYARMEIYHITASYYVTLQKLKLFVDPDKVKH
jgi:hypothetical protein